MLARALFLILLSSSPPRRTNKVVIMGERGDSPILSLESISKRELDLTNFQNKRIIEYFMGTYRKVSKTYWYSSWTPIFFILVVYGLWISFLLN